MKKSLFSELISQLVPDEIEDAWKKVDDYLVGDDPEDEPSRLHRLTQETMMRFGDPVRNALYSVLCDEDNPLHKTTKIALDKGMPTAVAALAPALASQFSLAGAAVPLVATLIVRFLGTQGSKKFCAELEPDDKPAKEKDKPKPKPSSAKPKKPASGSSAKPKPKPSTAKPKKPSSASASDSQKPATKPKPKPSAKPKKPASSSTSKPKPKPKPKTDGAKPKKPRPSSTKPKPRKTRTTEIPDQE